MKGDEIMTRETTARVCCQSLNKSYVVPGREGLTRQALQDVSFQARDGELVSVVGPSGSGNCTVFPDLSRAMMAKLSFVVSILPS